MAIDDVPCCEAYEVHEDKIRAANEQMPDEDELYDLAELFKVFGDSTRIRILFVLFQLGDVCMRSGTVTEYERSRRFHISLRF